MPCIVFRHIVRAIALFCYPTSDYESFPEWTLRGGKPSGSEPIYFYKIKNPFTTTDGHKSDCHMEVGITL